MPLTHINDQGRARMVDVSEKAITHRIAVAAGSIYMQPETLQAIIDGQIKKGDVLAVAQVHYGCQTDIRNHPDVPSSDAVRH